MIKSAAKLKKSLWHEVKRDDPTISRLIKYTEHLKQKNDIIKGLFQEMFKISEGNIRTLEIYS
jgi:hypothetical protein